MKFSTYRDQQRLIVFLMALTDIFVPIQASSLHRSSLLSLDQAISKLLLHSSLIIPTKFLLLHLLITTLPYRVQILLAALLLHQAQSSVVTVIAWTEVCFISLLEFVAITAGQDQVTSSMIVREIMIEVVIPIQLV